MMCECKTKCLLKITVSRAMGTGDTGVPALSSADWIGSAVERFDSAKETIVRVGLGERDSAKETVRRTQHEGDHRQREGGVSLRQRDSLVLLGKSCPFIKR